MPKEFGDGWKASCDSRSVWNPLAIDAIFPPDGYYSENFSNQDRSEIGNQFPLQPDRHGIFVTFPDRKIVRRGVRIGRWREDTRFAALISAFYIDLET
jgi:hypothetical protein